MNSNYQAPQFIVVNSSVKSTGLSVILTLVFGSWGLFYSTIMGGLVMTFSGIVFAIFLVYKMFTTLGSWFDYGLFGPIGMLAGYYSIIMTYLIISRVISLIWGIMAVNDYNRQLLSQQQYHQQSYPPFVQPQPINPTPVQKGDNEMSKWFQENPGGSLNDYFRWKNNS